MERRDFEAEHAVHSQYPKIVPHYHEFYELYFFLTGHADYVVGDVRFQLESGREIESGEQVVKYGTY